DAALASLEEALACHRRLGDRRAEGAALCQLSRILWCPGRLEESFAASEQALEVLEQLSPGRELGLAYVTRPRRAAFPGGAAGAGRWARRALEVGEPLGDTDTVVAASIDLAGMEAALGDPEGPARLRAALELAAEAGLETEVGRA